MARLSPLERSALDRFAAEARARLGTRLVCLTLFGSRARGEGRDDSDLDVLVLVRGMTRADRRQLVDDAADVGLTHDLVLSPLVADADAWRDDLPIARSIAQDGVPL